MSGSNKKKKNGEGGKVKPKQGDVNPRPLKITTVGDGMVGKTCLLITYTKNVFPYEYVPTVFDNFSDLITVDDKQFAMTLWDTAGQEDYERLRPLSYPNTDCFILCYSISSSASYENVFNKWYPEIHNFNPKTPIILVATKTDLRETKDTCESSQDANSQDNEQPKGCAKMKSKPSSDNSLISTRRGKKLARKINAYKFVECSALKQENLGEVFEQAVRSVLAKQKKSFCTIL